MASKCEIVEANEGFSTVEKIVKDDIRSKQARVYSIDDDINQLFNSMNIKTSIKAEAIRRNPMKRPIRANSLRAQGFGMTESVNLKQALRGLCISQASEMAAMKKKSLKPVVLSEITVVGPIVRTKGPSLRINDGKRNLEIYFPGKITSSKDKVVPLPQGSDGETSSMNSVWRRKLQKIRSLNATHTTTKDLEKEQDSAVTKLDKGPTNVLNSESCLAIDKVKNTRSISPLRMYQFRRNLTKRKGTTQPKAEDKVVDTKSADVSNIINTFSQSSKGSSSMGEYTCSTSEESSASGSRRCCNRPHMSKDARWESIHSLQKKYGVLSLKHFKLLKRLGSGDIGTVYLAELVDTNYLFALKVMDNEFLGRREKLVRSQVEREILQMLDHPFLPTLYAHFTTEKLSCLVMEYCPGGDLHVIRQRQPSRCFSEQAARFYVAEVLLALEYLHMLGIVYRDLKPENILVREDGHIMLTDFDLSLRCVVNPTLLTSSSSPLVGTTKKTSSSLCSESSCIDPFCLQPSWQVSCFTPRLLEPTRRTHKHESDLMPQLVAEPTDARSNSFVGTHEYLAPEIIKGEGHGSAVDWWTYGIFLYELVYGKTPFKGCSNEETLANVVSQPLKFPGTPLVSFHAKDLVRGLLVKQPQNRLGFAKGAAEIKQHPFFEGLNWALIRCAAPPERPKFHDVGHNLSSSSRKDKEFELF